MKIAFFGVCRNTGTTLHARTLTAVLRLCVQEQIQICREPDDFICSQDSGFCVIDGSEFPESSAAIVLEAADLIIVSVPQTGEGIAHFFQEHHRLTNRVRILIGRYSPGCEYLHRQWILDYRLESLEIGKIPYSQGLCRAVTEGNEVNYLNQVLTEQDYFYREQCLIQAVFQLLRFIEEIEGEGIWRKFLSSMDPQLSQYWRFSQLLEY